MSKVYYYLNFFISLIRDNYNIILYYIETSLTNFIIRGLKNYFKETLIYIGNKDYYLIIKL